MQAKEITSAEISRQRRYIAVLYSDLCGSTELAGSLEAELYSEVLDALNATYREIIPKHGGTLLQVHGDGFLAMFGYPGAGEEDVRLAVNAALDMHQLVSRLRLNIPDLPADLRLRLHSGIRAGLVLVQEGDVYGGSYQLRGEVTNICARLSAEAAEDEILVCEESLRGSEPFFKCGEQRDLQLKGISEAIAVCPVIGVTDLSTRYQARRRRSRLAFTGRSREHATLIRQWRAVQAGAPRLVYISGAPGVGKTRLVDEFLSPLQFQGQLVLRGSCETLSTAQPLESFIHMLRAAARQHLSLLDAHPGLQSALADYAENPHTLSVLASAVVEFVVARCAQGPLLIFIDDWQWADESSRRLLTRLAVRRDLPLMLILATRSVEAAESNMLVPSMTMQLDGLDGDELDTAIHALLPQVDPFARQQIASLSGGNPLFLEELCQAPALGLVEHAPSRVEHVPQWLYSMVQERVSQLNARERRIVQVAAVIGTTVPLWLLQRVAEFDDIESLTGLTVLDLLFPGSQPGEWHFKHGLTRAIVYDFVGLRQRQSLHRTIAQALVESDIGEDQHLEALAYHFAGAGMREEAVHYAIQAGERALSVPALDIARVQYRMALDLLGQGDITPSIYEQIWVVARRLSYVAIFDPSTDELPVFERLLKLAREHDDTRAEANANYWLARVYYGIGQPRRALHFLYQARTLAQACGHENLATDTQVALAQATAANCQHSVAIPMLERALRQAPPPGDANSPRTAGAAYGIGCLGMVLGDQGDFEGALARFAEAADLIGDTGNPTEANVLAKLIAVHIWRGDWDAAITTADKVARISEQVKNFYLFSMSRMLSAYAHWRRDGGEEYLDTMRETTGWLEKLQLGQFLSLNYGWLTEVCAEHGAYDEARRYAAKTFRRARQGDGFGLATAARALSEMSFTLGWPRSPERYLDIAERSAQQRSSAREQALNDACAQRLATRRAAMQH